MSEPTPLLKTGGKIALEVVGVVGLGAVFSFASGAFEAAKDLAVYVVAAAVFIGFACMRLDAAGVLDTASAIAVALVAVPMAILAVHLFVPEISTAPGTPGVPFTISESRVPLWLSPLFGVAGTAVAYLLGAIVAHARIDEVAEGAVTRVAQQARERADAAQTRVCPDCKEEIKAAAIVCKHCNRDLEPEPG